MNPYGNVKHGGVGTLTYARWKSMLQRCTNPAAANFKYYGGIGITVCDQWRNSYASFLADLGECPSRLYTLERKDNSLGYQPGNCTWATKAEQNAHRSNVLQLTHDGRTMNAVQWSAELGISANTIRTRIRLGWSVERTLTTPLKASGIRKGKP